MVLADGDRLDMGEFPQIAAQISAAGAPPLAEAEPHEPASDHTEASGDETVSPATPIAPDLAAISAPAPFLADALPLLDADGEVRPLEALEADLIRYAITHYRGQMSEVARRLQIGRSTLYRKLEALGLSGGSDAETAYTGVAEGVARERQPRRIA